MSFKSSEIAAIVATVDPDAYATGAQNSDWVDMEKWENIYAFVAAGVIVSSGTVDFKLQQATSSTGAGAKDITGKAITQLTTGDNDEQSVINLRATELDVANNFKYARGVMTLTTAGADAAVFLIGLNPRRGPASDNDLASVGEIDN